MVMWRIHVCLCTENKSFWFGCYCSMMMVMMTMRWQWRWVLNFIGSYGWHSLSLHLCNCVKGMRMGLTRGWVPIKFTGRRVVKRGWGKRGWLGEEWLKFYLIILLVLIGVGEGFAVAGLAFPCFVHINSVVAHWPLCSALLHYIKWIGNSVVASEWVLLKKSVPECGNKVIHSFSGLGTVIQTIEWNEKGCAAKGESL